MYPVKLFSRYILAAAVVGVVCLVLEQGCLVEAKVYRDGSPPLHSDVKPGDIWIRPKDGAQMIFIPSQMVKPRCGTGDFRDFQLEDSRDQIVGQTFPVEEQAFVTGFFLDRHEVTNRQFQQFMKATGANAPHAWEGESIPTGKADYPVIVSFQEADVYTEWVGCELPSCLKMMSACTDQQGMFPWCSTADIAIQASDFGLKQTSRVSSSAKDVTPLGVSDLVGNILEWTSTAMRSNRGWRDTKAFLSIAFGHIALPNGNTTNTQKWAIHWGFRKDGKFTFGFRCSTGSLPFTGPTCDASHVPLPENAPCIELRNLATTAVGVTFIGGPHFSLEAKERKDIRVLQGEWTVFALGDSKGVVYTFTLYNYQESQWYIHSDGRIEDSRKVIKVE